VATLTIKANASSANKAFERMTKMIAAAERSTARFAQISKTLASHFQTATQAVLTLNKAMGANAQATMRVAAVAKTIPAHYNASTQSVQRTTQAMARLRKETQGVAKAAAAVRTPRGGGGGRVGPPALPTAPSINPAAITTSVGSSITAGAVKAFSGIAGIAAKALSGLASIITKIFTTAFKAVFRIIKVGLTAALTVSAAAFGNALRLAVKKQPLAEGFGSLTASKGLGDQAEVLKDLRSAARGTVSDLDLMAQSNKAMLLGSADTTKQLQFLITAGRRLGKVMGRTASEGFDDLAIGIGRQSRLILDNLGLIIKIEAANESYAKAIGRTTDELTDSEKKLAFQGAAFQAIREKMAGMGEEQLLAVDRMGQLGAAFSNVSAEVGEKFLPALTEVAGRWAEFIKGFSADEIMSAVKGGFDALKGGAGSVLDFLVGKNTELRKSLTNAGGAFWEAMTNPSADAFKILSIRFDSLAFNMGSVLMEQWDVFVSHAVESGGKIFPALLEFLGPPGQPGQGDLRKREFRRDRAGIRESREEQRFVQNRISDDKIILLRRAIEANRKATELNTQAATTGRVKGGPSAGGITATGAGGSQLERQANLERELADQAAKGAAFTAKLKKAEADAAKAATKALKDQEKVIKESIRALTKETDKREKVGDALRAGLSNVSGAKVGASGTGMADLLNDIADEIRGFPKVFADLKNDVAEAGKAISDAMAATGEALQAAKEKAAQDLDKSVRSFLTGGQTATTTRGRSLQRRAQREQRRAQKAQERQFLGSASFGGGGGFQGFGAQGMERAGSLLEAGVPGLRDMMANVVNPQGTTAIIDLQKEIAAIVTEGNAKQTELEATRQEAVAAQKAAQEERLALGEKTADLEKQVLDILEKEAQDINKLKAELKALQRQLEQVRREARKTA